MEEARILQCRLDEQERAATPRSSITAVSTTSPVHPIPAKIKIRNTTILDPLHPTPRRPSKFSLFQFSKRSGHPKSRTEVPILPRTALAIFGVSNQPSSALQDVNWPERPGHEPALSIHAKKSVSVSRNPSLCAHSLMIIAGQV